MVDSGPTSGNRMNQVVRTQDPLSLQPSTNGKAELVHEWIDTLLQAAVIATDKQQQTREPDGQSCPAIAIALTTRSGSARSTGAAINVLTSLVNHDTNSIESVMVSDTLNECKDHDDDESLTSLQSIEHGNARKEDDRASGTTRKRYQRRRCEVIGCTKFARFNNACSGHGGRRLCAETGCTRVAQFGHKCSAHGGMKLCSVEGCFRAVQSRGCCKTHGGGVRCQYPDCTKGAISKGFCRSHGGGSRCAEESCEKWAQRHGYCVRHSKGSTGTNEVGTMEEVKSDTCTSFRPVEPLSTD
uniref:WRKY19-like zinc finger domain-containing protein n=1 Tax=Hyaloperonospora arabidopsidis (strain Emoy2) TaxID=559515 RepID=M4B752_HYAAE